MSDAENKVAPPEELPATTESVAAPADSVPASAEVEAVSDAQDKPAEEGTKETQEETAEASTAAPLLKTTAKINREDHTKNVKFDPAALPETDDHEKIRAQVEFYFGDHNLPKDKFMWDTTGGTENKPVSLKTLHTFKRMRRFQPYSAVVAALRDSKVLEVIGEADDEQVKRKVPYKSDGTRKAKQEAATVYVKGFGDEEPTTQFELEAFFTQFGAINAVKLRRTPERLFKGSVFVEFNTEELAAKFIELAPQWKNHDLKIMTKKAYCAEKDALIKEGKLEPSSSTKSFYEGHERRGGRARGRGRDGPSDSGDWKKRREDDQKNGFRGRGRGRGRGGRGGRGGFGRRRDDVNGFNNGKPPVDMAAMETAKARESETNGKRARDDDGSDERPAKKVAAEAA